MAAVQFVRQWHSTQPVNTWLRGWWESAEPQTPGRDLGVYTNRYRPWCSALGLDMKCERFGVWHDEWWMFLESTGLSYSCEFSCCPQISFLNNSGNKTLFKVTIHYTQIGQLTVYPCMLPKQFHNVLYIFRGGFCQYDSEQYDLVQYLYKIHYGSTVSTHQHGHVTSM